MVGSNGIEASHTDDESDQAAFQSCDITRRERSHGAHRESWRAMSAAFGLAVSEDTVQCSCPCSVAHRGPYQASVHCEDTIPAGRKFGVMVLDGHVVIRRCQPCAFAAGWIASVVRA